MNRVSTVIVLLLVTLTSCSVKESDSNSIVNIKTSYGNIKIKLYDETPLHRDNFIKLVQNGYYNNTLFHRVINEFMIQGGDPDSKGAPAGIELGNGGPGYKIPAEIEPNLFHKRGVLAAARMGDSVNPERRSSGSQFYIVHGEVFDDEGLDKIELRKEARELKSIVSRLLKLKSDSIDILKKSGDFEGFSNIRVRAEEQALKECDSTLFIIPENIREIYRTIGGTPHLDGAYTVFGEVIEGLSVVDSIAAVQVNSSDRPLENIKMTITIEE